MNQVELELLLNNGVFEVVIPIWSVAKSKYFDAFLIVDTGASFLTLHPESLEFLGYKPKEELHVTTASQVEIATMYTVSSILLGETFIENVEVIGQELPYQMGASGLLGLNVLTKFVSEFHFKDRKLILKG
jgi:predicted aspartyl protease